MQERFDIELDPFALARKGRSIAGRIPSKLLTRVVDLIGSEGEFDAQLDFGIDNHGLRFVRGSAHGRVTLQCQRCLETYQDTLDVDFTLALVKSEQQIAALPEEYEPLLVEDDVLLLKDIIEDEIILALPTAPVHSAQECSAAQTEESQVNSPQLDEQTQRPFAGLAELMKQKK